MIFNTRARLHAAAHIDAERLNSADRLGHIVGPKAAGKNQPAAIKSVEPFPGKSSARAAVPRRPGIQQIEVRGKIGEPVECAFLLQTKCFDDLQAPAGTKFRALLAMKLQRAVEAS